jgi:hypothetical protein
LTREKYEIVKAFESNNFNYIRNLPLHFEHKTILDKKKEKVEESKNSKVQN